jgi:oligopeptide/dipeptide ABC transporter ATP-binding protein
MTVTQPMVRLENVALDLRVGHDWRPILRDVSLTVAAGEAVGLVGESGSGKSMTARTIARLLPDGARVTGTVEVNGVEVNSLSGRALRAHRTNVGVIFQDPKAHINPVRTIGDFMTESLVLTRRRGRSDARRAAVRALEEVGVSRASQRLDQYPHELSGGLLQRVMIATTLLTEPPLLLADEPTTALDVTTQAEVVAILDELRRERGLALVFITHDLDLAGAMCDRTAVMYAGEIVETGPSATMHSAPRHPYTQALGSARPSLDHDVKRLPAIPGRPISPAEAPPGCAFEARCPFSIDRCSQEHPSLEELAGGQARCVRAGTVQELFEEVKR